MKEDRKQSDDRAFSLERRYEELFPFLVQSAPGASAPTGFKQLTAFRPCGRVKTVASTTVCIKG